MTKNRDDVKNSSHEPRTSDIKSPNHDLGPKPANWCCVYGLWTCLEPFIAVFKTAVFGIKASLKCLMRCRTRGARTGRAEGEWSDEINQAGNKDARLLCSLLSDFTPKTFLFFFFNYNNTIGLRFWHFKHLLIALVVVSDLGL